jgi:hypothetical protein
MDAADPYTAPSGCVPTRRAGPVTLADAFRAWRREPSPPVLLAAVALALAGRLALVHPSWRDLIVIGGILAATPFVEWGIHVYLLHSRPLAIAGRRVEMISAREHRAHHEAPGVLEGVLLPLYGVAAFVPMIAAVVVGLSFPIHSLLGGDQLRGVFTGLACTYAILASYEWVHYLIHTPYRPRGRYYRAIWRGHRLHHYKNERYWFGVTSTLADRVIGTNPDQHSVPRSRTARSLHGV